ncbi:hypothetical protein ABBQ38_005002 [Trebouxia sp. C0009 RCD-2024]
MLPGNSSGTAASPSDLELQPILTGQASPARDRTKAARAKQFLREPVTRAALGNLALILTWYFFSTLLSLWNRKLVGEGHGVFGKGAFPAPLMMTAFQFAIQNLLCRGVLKLGIVQRSANAVELNWHQYFRQVFPNGICTGLDIGLSNFSLALITLSFYTMCKSTVPVFLLGFAFLWGIERPSWSLAGVVGIISCGLLLLVYGESNFNPLGFAVVMTASMLSGLRWTITQVLLQGTPGSSGHGASGGPVEVLLQLTPVMATTVALMSLLVEHLWDRLPGSPYFASPAHVGVTALILCVGALLAFMMVWVEFTVIAQTSALTFMVAGTFKEVVTVMAAVLFLGEDFYLINALGLGVLIMGVFWFNYLKYKKVAAGEIKASKSAALEPYKAEDAPDMDKNDDQTTPKTEASLTSPVYRGADQASPRVMQ